MDETNKKKKKRNSQSSKECTKNILKKCPKKLSKRVPKKLFKHLKFDYESTALGWNKKKSDTHRVIKKVPKTY